MPKFNLPLTTAISAAILATTACSNSRDWQTDNDTKVCIDSDGNRINEGNCNRNNSADGWSPYRWYYISRGGYIPYYGNTVSGGSYFPSTTSTYANAPAEPPPGAVTRAGFGSHAEAGEGFHGGAGE